MATTLGFHIVPACLMRVETVTNVGRSRLERKGLCPRPVGADQTCEEEKTMTSPAVSFESDIKPLFRQKDQQSMSGHFDLWSFGDVTQHADAILGRLKAGNMPCDGAWPPAQVELFQSWIDGGKRP